MKNKEPINRLAVWRVFNPLGRVVFGIPRRMLAKSIRLKLLANFMLMVAIIVSVGVIALVNQNRAQKTFHEFINTHGRIHNLSLEAQKTMLTVDLAGLQYNKVGDSEEKAHLVNQVKDDLTNVREMLDEIVYLNRDPQLNSKGKIAVTAVTAYQNMFMEIVDLEERLKDPKAGAYSELFKSIKALDDTLLKNGVDNPEIANLILRPNQVDSKLADKAYVENLGGTVTQLKSRISALGLVAVARDQLMSLLAQYQAQVENIIWMEEQIAAGKKAIPTLASKAEVLLDSVQAGSVINEENAKNYMDSLVRQNFWMTIGVAVASTVFGLLLVAWLSGRLTRQIRLIMNLFSEVGMGNFDARTKVMTQDELGQMAESLNAMLDNTMTLIQTREERDEMQQSIMKLLDEISNLSEGDLTVRAQVTEDMTGTIADSFNMMIEQLSQIVHEVKQASQQVGQTSSEVSSTTEKLAESSENQADQISSIITSINAMSASIQKVAKHAVESANVSEKSTRDAKEGAEAVQVTNQAMESIRERVQETAQAIKRLGESSQEIGNIVQIINDIADRTSILALNASIQAAMAGDAGRGFSVVAEEVQRLSEKSTNSTKQIETLVKNIQSEINEAGTRMEESIQQVVEGSQLAVNAHQKLKGIEDVSAQLAQRVHSISTFAKQQTQVSEKISKNMQAIGSISSETATVSRQAASAMKNMTATSEKLLVSVESFKVEEDDDRGIASPIVPEETLYAIKEAV